LWCGDGRRSQRASCAERYAQEDLALIEKREHARYAIELDVELVDETGRHPGKTRDLSIGGMFVSTSERLRFGSDIVVALILPALKERTALAGTVRWQTSEGVGVQFRSLRARDVWALNALFKQAGVLR
jgi:Tfp pilus assembly protein PilZ